MHRFCVSKSCARPLTSEEEPKACLLAFGADGSIAIVKGKRRATGGTARCFSTSEAIKDLIATATFAVSLLARIALCRTAIVNAACDQAACLTLVPMMLTKGKATKVTSPFLDNRTLALFAVPIAAATSPAILQVTTHALVALKLAALVALVSFAKALVVTLLSAKLAVTDTTNEWFGVWRKSNVGTVIIGRQKKDGILTLGAVPLLDCDAHILVGIGKLQNGFKVSIGLLHDGSNNVRWKVR